MDFYKTFQQKKATMQPRTHYVDHPRKRGQSVTIRMSVEERAQLEELYKQSTVPSKQAYLLAAVLQAPILTEYGEEQYRTLLHEVQSMARQVNGIAHNLNQLTRYAHEQRQFASLSSLQSVTAQLMEVLEKVNGSLSEPLSRYPHPAKSRRQKEG